MKAPLLIAIVSLSSACQTTESEGQMNTKIEVISTSRAPKAVGPYSQATRARGFLFCAGQGAFDPTTGQLVEGGIKEKTRQVLRNV